MGNYSYLILFCSVMVASSASGQATGAFTRLGFGARGNAMGNALSADVFGQASAYYNPALAPFTDRQNLSASVGVMRFDRSLQYLQFAAPLKPRAGITLGLVHAAVTDIDGRDNSGFPTSNFSTYAFALFMAFGLRLGS